MKNYFIIHGSFGNGSEHYFPWLKKKLEKKGEVICLDFPVGVDKQNFKNWAKCLDKYKDKISKDSIFVGRSIGPIFAIKYLMQNNLHIKQLVAVSGFNNTFVDGGDYDKVNKSMYVDNLKEFKNYCDKVVCFYSENDPYLKLSALKDFEKQISNISINIKNGGHFNTDSGYGKKFDMLLKFVD